MAAINPGYAEPNEAQRYLSPSTALQIRQD